MAITRHGNQIDVAIAAANGSCKNSGRGPETCVGDAVGDAGGVSAAPPFAPACVPNRESSCADIIAAIAADPITAPIWRVVLYTLEPAPANFGSRLRVAIMESGPQIIELATP